MNGPGSAVSDVSVLCTSQLGLRVTSSSPGIHLIWKNWHWQLFCDLFSRSLIREVPCEEIRRNDQGKGGVAQSFCIPGVFSLYVRIRMLRSTLPACGHGSEHETHLWREKLIAYCYGFIALAAYLGKFLLSHG